MTNQKPFANLPAQGMGGERVNRQPFVALRRLRDCVTVPNHSQATNNGYFNKLIVKYQVIVQIKSIYVMINLRNIW